MCSSEKKNIEEPKWNILVSSRNILKNFKAFSFQSIVVFMAANFLSYSGFLKIILIS